MENDQENKQASKTLIEYQVIDISDVIFDDQDTNEQSKVAQNLASQVSNIPIEIRGQAPLFLISKLFTLIRNIAPEIIYRATEKNNAYIIHSTLDEEKYIRPSDVIDSSLWWSDEQLEEFEKNQANDSQKNIAIDLEQTWNKIKGEEEKEKLKKYLSDLYNTSPNKDKVEITGNAPIVPSLMTINWFIVNGKIVTYNKEKLK